MNSRKTVITNKATTMIERDINDVTDRIRRWEEKDFILDEEAEKRIMNATENLVSAVNDWMGTE